MKENYISILSKIVLTILSIILIAIFIVEINISIEFLLIIGVIFILPYSLIVIKLISDMKRKEKENEALNKMSETYIKNKNVILKKFRIILILTIFFELMFFWFNYICLICMCGHHEFKILPMLIFIILQIGLYIYNYRFLKNKDAKVKTLIDYYVISFVLFLAIVICSKNNMDELHRVNEVI